MRENCKKKKKFSYMYSISVFVNFNLNMYMPGHKKYFFQWLFSTKVTGSVFFSVNASVSSKIYKHTSHWFFFFFVNLGGKKPAVVLKVFRMIWFKLVFESATPFILSHIVMKYECVTLNVSPKLYKVVEFYIELNVDVLPPLKPPHFCFNNNLIQETGFKQK